MSKLRSNPSSLVPGAIRVVAQGLTPCYVVVAAVALVGLGVVLGIGELRPDRQSFEVAVLKARGPRTSKLFWMQAAEAALMAVLAPPLSLAVGLALPGAPLPIT